MERVLILNVDDNEAGRYAKTRLLENAGFRVEEACDGETALALSLTLRPHIVLLDVRLPDIDGRAVCRQLKAQAATRDAFVVHTSAAFITARDIASGYASGADHYIPVPYEPQHLIATLRSLVH